MYTVFEAGDKQYKLRYTANALCEFERKYDIGVLEAMNNSKNIYYTRGLIWAGLLTYHPKTTTEQAGEIIDEYFDAGNSFSDLVGVLTEALQGAGFFRTNGSEMEKKPAAQGKSKK